MLGILILFFVIGYSGNVATFVTLKIAKGLRPFTKMILCMIAFWDIMMLLILGLCQFVIIQENLNLRNMNIYFHISYRLSRQFIQYCGIWHLSVTSIERMCFVVWPTNPTIRRASVKEAVIISFGLIIFAFILSVIPFIWIKFSYLISTSLIIIFGIIIPFILLLTSSVIVHYKLENNLKTINPFPRKRVSVSTLLSIKMVIIGSIYYFITSASMSSLVFTMKYFDNKNKIFNLYENLLFNIFSVLLLSNSSLKFYLYTIFIPHVRERFINICLKIIWKIKLKFNF